MTVRGIVLFLFVGVAMLVAAAAVVLSAVFLVELWRIEGARRRQTHPRSAFLKKLMRGLDRKTLQDIGELHHAYRSFFGVSVLRSSHLEEIAELLQRAELLFASDPQASPGVPPQAKMRVVQELLAANQRALEVEHLCMPFSGTPEPERKLLEDLLGLATEDKAKVSATLEALAKVIRLRHDSVARFACESSHSIKVARWGWYGTLALAILAAILGLMCLGS